MHKVSAKAEMVTLGTYEKFLKLAPNDPFLVWKQDRVFESSSLNLCRFRFLDISNDLPY